MNAIGKRIRLARLRRGLTQTQLADATDLSRTYIAKLEGGERQAPSLGALAKLAKVLRVKLVDLLR